MAQYFDYYSGLNTHNGRWDLEVLRDHLRTRDDIEWHYDHGAFNSLDEDPIQQIPGYNAEPDQTKFIAFIWKPSLEDFRTVYAHADSDDEASHIDLQKAIFDTDILGLRAAGANFYEDYYGSIPVQKGMKL
jgi:hypothetical protein